jgi:hypothetical protein
MNTLWEVSRKTIQEGPMKKMQSPVSVPPKKAFRQPPRGFSPGIGRRQTHAYAPPRQRRTQPAATPRGDSTSTACWQQSPGESSVETEAVSLLGGGTIDGTKGDDGQCNDTLTLQFAQFQKPTS